MESDLVLVLQVTVVL